MAYSGLSWKRSSKHRWPRHQIPLLPPMLHQYLSFNSHLWYHGSFPTCSGQRRVSYAYNTNAVSSVDLCELKMNFPRELHWRTVLQSSRRNPPSGQSFRWCSCPSVWRGNWPEVRIHRTQGQCEGSCAWEKRSGKISHGDPGRIDIQEWALSVMSSVLHFMPTFEHTLNRRQGIPHWTGRCSQLTADNLWPWLICCFIVYPWIELSWE